MSEPIPRALINARAKEQEDQIRAHLIGLVRQALETNGADASPDVQAEIAVDIVAAFYQDAFSGRSPLGFGPKR